ncbi:hypothetical protein H5410_065054 [Solanum commersonii]|uniref:DUF7746 domain-containing protein n=1 Tax=Solanum commersonii TaxID=4109 RepID=A0A9J5VXL1_SOLCO|nr:hypothetical protein H5410_065054 [Solanum commersonii]
MADLINVAINSVMITLFTSATSIIVRDKCQAGLPKPDISWRTFLVETLTLIQAMEKSGHANWQGQKESGSVEGQEKLKATFIKLRSTYRNPSRPVYKAYEKKIRWITVGGVPMWKGRTDSRGFLYLCCEVKTMCKMIIAGFTGQLKGWWDNYMTHDAKAVINAKATEEEKVKKTLRDPQGIIPYSNFTYGKLIGAYALKKA